MLGMGPTGPVVSILFRVLLQCLCVQQHLPKSIWLLVFVAETELFLYPHVITHIYIRRMDLLIAGRRVLGFLHIEVDS